MKPIDPRRRVVLAFGLLLFLAAFLLASGLARAAQCGPRAAIVDALKQRHGPRPRYIAMTDRGRVLELWSGADGAWALLLTSPEGYACIQATGPDAWEALVQGEPA